MIGHGMTWQRILLRSYVIHALTGLMYPSSHGSPVNPSCFIFKRNMMWQQVIFTIKTCSVYIF